jgi:hypothetical protein
MKKIILFITIVLLISATAKSQQMNKEKIKLLKTSYITDALSLTSTEAEKFWPVYNLYMDHIKKLKKSGEKDIHREIMTNGGIDAISEKQAQEYINISLKLQENIYNNKKEMTEKLLNILPPKKILKLQKAERDFNRRMLQEYGKRKRLQMQ